MNTNLNKAVMAVLGGLATILGAWGLEFPPELVTAVGTMVTAVLVYVVPNKS